MGNASSRYFSQEELNKLKSDLETGGVEKIQPLLVKKLKELDKTELNVAVTGNTGAGKSTFINAMRGLRGKDVGGAATGSTETTMEPTGYPHPNLPNVRYWDLPGIGSPRFTAGSYLKEMQFKKYDFFIIVTATRFTENDAKLANEIKRLGKRFYFVRSKIDVDLNAMREEGRESDEVAELEKIQSDCVSRLGKAGIPDPIVFLISSFKKEMYDFPRFLEALVDGLPNMKESVFVLALPNLSVEVIRKKREVLKTRIWMWAIISGGVGAVPVPGLSAACDIGILIGTIIYFRECLCLDDASLRRLAERTGTSVGQLKAVADSFLVGEISASVMARLGLSETFAGVSAMEATLHFVPGIGSIFGAGSSFLMTYLMLSDALECLVGSAEKVLAFVKRSK